MLALLNSRAVLLVALFGALLVVAVVLQVAESAWQAVSPPRETASLAPSTDPEEIRAFLEEARPELDVEGRTVTVHHSDGYARIRFDTDEDEEMETLLACVESAHDTVMAKLFEETSEVPTARLARRRLRNQVRKAYDAPIEVCIREAFDLPQIPELPGID